MSIRHGRKRWLALSAAVAAGLAGADRRLASAQNTWQGTTTAWDTGANWSLNHEPDGTETAVFPAAVPTAGRTVLLTAGELADALTFNGGYFLRGGDLALASGNVTLTTGTGTVPGGSTAFPSTLNTSNASPMGGYVLSALGGSNGLTLAGAGGVLELGGTNTFAGNVTVGAGAVLRIDRNANLGAAANGVALNGGSLQLASTGLPGTRTITNSGATGTLLVPRNSTTVIDGVLAGSGTLTRTGQGLLLLRGANTFSGDLVIAPNTNHASTTINSTTLSGTMLRDFGTLTAVSSITVGQGSFFGVENDGNNALPVNNRVNDAAVINLRGGTFNVHTKDTRVTDETVGAVNLQSGNSVLRSQPQGGGSHVNFRIASLNRTANTGATVLLSGWNLGQTTNADNSQILINEPAAGGGVTPTLVNNIIGGWAIAQNNAGTVSTDFATYKPTNGVGNLGNTGLGFVGYDSTDIAAGGNTATMNVNQAAATTAVTVPGAMAVNALRVSTTAASTVTLNGPLTLSSGGLLTSANNNVNVAFNGTGSLTAGAAADTAAELFVHVIQAQTTIGVPVTNNGTGAVSLTKTSAGTLVLNAATSSTYSGGSFFTGGTVTTGATDNTTYLGAGPVSVDNTQLTLGAIGAVGASFTPTAGTPTYRAFNVSQISFPNKAVADNETFSVEGGSVIAAGSGALTGLNSLDAGAGGNVTLAEDAIVAHATFFNDANNGTNAPTAGRTIRNLPTDAKLFFGIAGGDATAGTSQGVTIGAGTPWKGISTERLADRRWTRGTVTIAPGTTDVYFQGAPSAAAGGSRILYFGNNTEAPTVRVDPAAPAADRPVVHLLNDVRFDSVNGNYAGDRLTYVAEPGASVTFSRAGAMGGAGGSTPMTLNVAAGARTLITVPDAINGTVNVFPGGGFVANNGSGLTGSGTINVDPAGVLQVDNANGIIGAQADPANGRFNLAGGTIVRVNADNVVNLGSNRIPLDAVLVAYNAARTFTSQATAENVPLGGGRVVTNDVLPRTINSGNGRFVLGAGGATLAATTNTTLSFSDDIDLGANTLTIGTADSFDGNPKVGVAPVAGTFTAVSFTQAGTRGTSGAVINVTNNYVVQQGATHSLADHATFDLDAGTFLRLTQGFSSEVVGGLAGAGNVVSNQTNLATLQVGYNDANTTFSGLFPTNVEPNSTANGNLTKIGTGTLTVTNGGGAAQATQWNGTLNVHAGNLALANNGAFNFGTSLVNEGGTLTLDNAAAVVGNRLGGTLTTKTLTVNGGEVVLRGNAGAAVLEQVGTLNVTNTGGVGAITIDPGAGGSTTLHVGTLQSSNNVDHANTTVLRGPGLGSAPGAGVATFIANTPNLIAGGGTANPYNRGIRPDVLGDTSLTGAGVAFVTQPDTTNGFRLLAPAEQISSFYSGYTTATNNVRMTFVDTSDVGEANVNSLTLAPGGGVTATATAGIGVARNQAARFIVGSGGIHVLPGADATIAAPFLDRNSNQPYFIHGFGDLTVNATVVGTRGFVKGGGGTLTLGDGALRGLTGRVSVNEGTVVLGAGNNTLPLANGTNNFTLPDLYVSGGTLQLNGNGQTVNNFNTSSPLPNSGGTIDNGGARATLTVQTGTFAGSVNGAIDLVKSGTGGLTLTSPSAFNGSLTLRGGTTVLRDAAVLSNLQSAGAGQAITAYASNLTVDNTNSLVTAANRIPTGSNLSLRGSAFIFNGHPGAAESQALGTVLLDGGQVQVTSGAGQNGATDVTIARLDRTARRGTTLHLTGNNIGRLAPAVGFNQDSRIFIAEFDNTNAVPADNSFLGGWVVVNNDHWGSYRADRGVGNYSGTGFPAYATSMGAGNVATFGGSQTLGAGGATVGALRLTAANSNITFNAGNPGTLTIESGGFVTGNANEAHAIGDATTRGTLTTNGTNDLYFHVNQGTTTVNAVVTGANVALVKNLGGTVTLTGNNAYGGGTFVNGGSLTLNTPGANGSSTVAVPGDLTLTATGVGTASSVTLSAAGQIRNTAVVTFNGGSTLTLVGNNTLGGLVFNGIGGAAPTLTVPTGGVLTLGNDAGANPGTIASVNDHVGTTPIIASAGAGAALDLNGGNRSVSVGGTSPLGLVINPILQNGGIVKSGTGLLALGGANTLTGGINIQAGAVRADAAGALGPAGNTTTVNANASLILNNAGPITGGIALNGGTLTQTANAVSSGPVSVDADSTVALADPYVFTTNRNTTITGVLSGSAARNLTVTGTNFGFSTTNQGGQFQLSNEANTYAGRITVNAGATLVLRNQAPAVGGTADVGSTLGSNPITLAGGALRILDNVVNSATPTVSTDYGNDLTVTAPSVLSYDRATTTFGSTGNTIPFGTIALGEQLTMTAANNYVASVAAINVTNAAGAELNNSFTVNLASLGGPGILTKAGAGALNVAGTAANFAGLRLTYGAVTFANDPGGGTIELAGPVSFLGNQATALNGSTSGNQVTFSSATVTLDNLLVSGGAYAFPTGKTFNVNAGANSALTVGPKGLAILANNTFNVPRVVNDGGIAGGINFTLPASSTLTGTGSYNPAGGTLNLGGAGGGVVQDTSPTVPTVLNVVGSTGTVIPNNALSHTGGTNVYGATLRATTSGASLGTGPIKVAGTGTLEFQPGAGNTVTVDAPAATVRNDNVIAVRNGTADLATKFITTQRLAPTGQVFTTLNERYFLGLAGGAEAFNSLNAAIPFTSFDQPGPTALNTPNPTYAGTIPDGTAANTTTFSTTAGAGINLRSGGALAGNAVFAGVVTTTVRVGGDSLLQPGPVSFGTTSDDGNTLYVDANNNGTFEASELVISNHGAKGTGNGAIGTIDLAAGTYAVAAGFYNTGSGGGLEIRFAPGNQVNYAQQTAVSTTAGAGVAASQLVVDASSTLLTGGFDTDTVLLTGGATAPARALISITAGAPVSSANTLRLAGATTPKGTATVGAGSLLSVQVLNLVANGTLVKDGGGTLSVLGTGTGSGVLDVQEGTLAGTGSIAGPVNVASGARLAPGASPGVLTIGGPLTLASGSTYAVELAGTEPGNGPDDYDQTNVTVGTTTALVLTGAVLDVRSINAFNNDDPAQVYYILTQPGTDPQATFFAGLAEGAPYTSPDGSVTGTITYQANWLGSQAASSPTGGNDVALKDVTVVPEPAGLALAAVGAAGLLARRRRRGT